MEAIKIEKSNLLGSVVWDTTVKTPSPSLCLFWVWYESQLQCACSVVEKTLATGVVTVIPKKLKVTRMSISQVGLSLWVWEISRSLSFSLCVSLNLCLYLQYRSPVLEISTGIVFMVVKRCGLKNLCKWERVEWSGSESESCNSLKKQMSQCTTIKGKDNYCKERDESGDWVMEKGGREGGM